MSKHHDATGCGDYKTDRGPFVQTYCGRKLHFHYPKTEDINYLDLAHSLSLLCRYTGHTRTFYSVAQHSILVALTVPEDLRAYGLLHDAAEAYVGDMARPLKHAIRVLGEETPYDVIENGIREVILRKFGLDPRVFDDRIEEIKHADNVVAATEKRDLLMDCPDIDWGPMPAPLKSRITPMAWQVVRTQFRDRLRHWTPMGEALIPRPARQWKPFRPPGDATVHNPGME